MAALFTRLDPVDDLVQRFLPTELGRGPWDDVSLHGGAIGALIAGVVESVPTLSSMMSARLTMEVERPVPLRPLAVTTEVRREGRRIQLVDVEVTDEEEGRVACRARCLRQRVGNVPLPDDAELAPVLALPASPPGPDAVEPRFSEWAGIDPLVRFHSHAVEHRLIAGSPDVPGPAVDWIRLTTDVVDGEAVTPSQRVAAAADFANGLSHVLDFRRHLFVNTDLTIATVRPAVGEWICLDSRTEHSEVGSGLSSTVLFDEDGFLGRSMQSLFVERR
jgi:acyl-coenzyme A thioesterase PaaI-like protein